MSNSSADSSAVDEIVQLISRPSKSAKYRKSLNRYWIVLLLAAVYIMYRTEDGGPLMGAALVVLAIPLVIFMAWPHVASMWRARVQVVVLACMSVFFLIFPVVWAILLILLCIGVVAAIPATRDYVVQLFWAVWTRHRLRGVFTRAMGIRKISRMPWQLRSVLTPIGERVTLWLPAGMPVGQIESILERISSACYSVDATVTKSTRWSHIVYLQIIRRGVLAEQEPNKQENEGASEAAANNADGAKKTRFTVPIAGNRKWDRSRAHENSTPVSGLFGAKSISNTVR